MSVGIFKNGKYNKVAGNAKDSTAANTTYNNGTSGLQANNVQSAIDELDSTIDTLNSNFITLTATLGSVGTSVSMNYPTGFNPNNCIVSCAKLELATNVFIPNIYTGETMFEPILFDTYIAFGTHSETAVGKKATIVLKKI